MQRFGLYRGGEQASPIISQVNSTVTISEDERDAGMSVSVYFGDELPTTPPVEIYTSTPFRILILADLGSEAEWGKPITIDRDDIEDVINGLSVQAELALWDQGPLATVQIGSMEDFHPDRLYQNVDLFKALRDQRNRIANSETFAAEIASSQATQQTNPEERSKSSGEEDVSEVGSNVLGAAIDLAQAQQIPIEQRIVDGTVDWDEYVRQLAAPFLVDKADPRQAEMLNHIDETIASTMRDVLHHPIFQQLEATWRGIHFLTDRLETNRTLQIAVLNISKKALGDDLSASDNLAQSQLHKLLIEQPNRDQEQPWNIVVGDYQFNSSTGDTQALGRIAKVCHAAGSAFVAGANASIAGCRSFGTTPDCEDWTQPEPAEKEAWNELRTLPASRSVALTLPRILLRRIYGAETDPIDSFQFEELPDGTCHEAYLWTNAAYGIAYIYGQTFSEEGRGFQNVTRNEIKRLPIHFYIDKGEECLQACAEAYLVDRCTEKLANLGLTIARSVKNEGEVRFERIRSLSIESSEWKVN